MKGHKTRVEIEEERGGHPARSGVPPQESKTFEIGKKVHKRQSVHGVVLGRLGL
eukprot:CAMPEP_0197447382 /NCGR_PEP_ID=MMETSP1175-20131217/13100_1 /TAXON_ID=1003142 /ORGANISM="Triceratium dubium, Strain CCMP147" /LENGTH=53 /DNA_ID=CAMNT_0042978665 /DNA_START=10 /DNA_END=168 /DNA_ORIENTATION=-